MKNILFLFLALHGVVLFGQDTEIKKPEYVIIANNEIISKEKLSEYGQQGAIKTMNKGVSAEIRNELFEKFGDKIGDKEFIITLDLFTEKGKKANQKKGTSSTKKPTAPVDDGLKLHVGDTATDFTVQMINGEEIKLSDLKGKVVLLNFWATWCGPCLMEFHELPKKILARFENSDFVLLPISRGETEQKVRGKMQQLNTKGITFNVGIDPKKEIWNEYATKYIPKNFLIDQNGEIQYISTGYSEGSLDKLAKEIKKLLKK